MQFTSSLRNGLIGAWCPSVSGWGGNVLRDLSGQGNHGTLTNMDPATDWVVSEGKQALDFDGVDDVVLTNRPIPALNEVTFSVWYFGNTANYISGIAFNTLAIRGFNPTYVFFQVESTSRICSATFNSGWNHIAIVGTFSLDIGYVNGIKRDSYSTVVRPTTSNVLALGARAAGGGGAGYGAGQFDDIRIYNRALSDNEIRLLASERGIGLRPERKRRYVSSTGNRRRRLICGANC